MQVVYPPMRIIVMMRMILMMRMMLMMKGDWVRRISGGQLGQLGGLQLVSELKPRNGNLIFNRSSSSLVISSSSSMIIFVTIFLSSSSLMIFVTIWTLQARMEMMDLETDVCRSRDLSLHLVPYKLKVSSRWLSYTSRFPQVGQNVRELIRHWQWKCRRYLIVMIKCKI